MIRTLAFFFSYYWCEVIMHIVCWRVNEGIA